HLFQLANTAVNGTIATGVEQLGALLRTAFTGRTVPHLDPNHWQTMRRGGEGLARIPAAITEDWRRSGLRERLLGVKNDPEHGARLHILELVCVTGLELATATLPAAVGGAEASLRAIGIRCLPRGSVYEADPHARRMEDGWEKDIVALFCKKEVILCGGTFNTPQLLMLSGIGPQQHLADHGIECRRALPGVGGN